MPFKNHRTRIIVRRQKPIFGVKCAISGNNHFFAFFISSCCVDEIWPVWELTIGLAFSESKTIDQPNVNVDRALEVGRGQLKQFDSQTAILMDVSAVLWPVV